MSMARSAAAVHYGCEDPKDEYGTYYWALKLKFTEADTKVIAMANKKVDFYLRSRRGPLPWWVPFFGGNQSYHFNNKRKRKSKTVEDTRYVNMLKHLRKAIELKKTNYQRSLRELGIALHPIQDMAFHTDDVSHRFLCIYWHPLWGNVDCGKSRPDALIKAKDYTDQVLNMYIKEKVIDFVF
jgi:hypothetical protein